MAHTESTMLGLGTQAPGFHLPNVIAGQTVTLDTFADDKALQPLELGKGQTLHASLPDRFGPSCGT